MKFIDIINIKFINYNIQIYLLKQNNNIYNRINPIIKQKYLNLFLYGIISVYLNYFNFIEY